MIKTRQGGSVLNFIIVAIVLVGLVIAGIYVVRQVTQQKEPSETAIEENSPEESQPEEEEQVEEQPVEVLPGESSVLAAELPQTGPAETFGAMVAMGALGLSLVYYVRSRREVLSL